MSQRVTARIEVQASLLVRRAFVLQALASLLVWVMVSDMSRGTGVFYSKDFGEWASLSVVCSVLIVVAAGAVLRRYLPVLAVAAGCLVEFMSGVAIFVGWAVVNSA
ncbi:hypothetical protein [Nocardioides zeicaulis]|uniref:Uncharacterized protein n=1 Tax=Nocardioides zeicaulis TaxID=1776857 RepID=A0ABV6E2Z0_9ACTN